MNLRSIQSLTPQTLAPPMANPHFSPTASLAPMDTSFRKRRCGRNGLGWPPASAVLRLRNSTGAERTAYTPALLRGDLDMWQQSPAAYTEACPDTLRHSSTFMKPHSSSSPVSASHAGGVAPAAPMIRPASTISPSSRTSRPASTLAAVLAHLNSTPSSADFLSNFLLLAGASSTSGLGPLSTTVIRGDVPRLLPMQ